MEKKKKSSAPPAPKRLPKAKAQSFRPEVHVAPDLNLLYHDAADLFVEVARRSVLGCGRFTVALCGGSTVKGFFRLLAEEPFRRQIPWKKTFIFWGDDRHVPQDSAESNFKTAWDHLLSRVPLLRSQAYPVTNGAGTPERGAEKYEKLMKAIWGSRQMPAFDFNLMGVGIDGHTAGLFPKHAALKEKKKWVVGLTGVDKMGRVSLTFPVFNAAKLTVVLAEGSAKAGMLQKVLEGKSDPPKYPVQHLRPTAGRLIFMLDAAAASKTKWDALKES